MNWVDRVVGTFSPKQGLERVRTRLVMDRVVKAYTAGQLAPRGREWAASSRGPNAELRPALRNLRQRNREMVRDNPYAKRAVNIRVAHEIGYGITPRPKTGDTDLDTKVLALWDQFVARSDPSGMLNFYGQQALAARTRAVSGEAFLRLIKLDLAEARKRRLKVPLQIEVMQPDLIADGTSIAGYAPVAQDGPVVVDGIEFDRFSGLRTGYRVLRQHPGEAGVLAGYVSGPSYDVIPARDMIHLMRTHAQEAGQVRGVPDATGALLRLRRLEEYEEAAVEQAKVQALLGVFFKTPGQLEMDSGIARGVSPEGEDGGLPTEVWPGMVANLPMGTEAQFLQPSNPGPFEPFALHELQAVAIDYRVTYDQLTGDLRQANYSSLRAGKIEFKRDVEQDQDLMHVPQMCQPIWDAFIQAVILVQLLPERDGGYPVEWSPPRPEMVDPGREIPAAIAAVRAGFQTWAQAVGSFGWDHRTQAEEISACNTLFDALGLVLSVDPRRTSDAGGAQDAKQNAAVELSAKNGNQNDDGAALNEE